MNGPTVGVIALDTRFFRPPGDAGNAASYAVPVRLATVPGAAVPRIVRPGAPDPALLAPFLAARDSLVAQGAGLVTTTCGFLAAWQAPLAHGCPVPVVASALSVIAPLLHSGVAPDRIGVLSYDAAALGPAHWRGAGAPEGLAVGSLDPAGLLRRSIAEDRPDFDLSAAEAEVVADAERLIAAHPGIDHLVFECANLPPYRRAVAAATRCRVLDLFDALEAAALCALRAT
jgi:hypothetical protein